MSLRDQIVQARASHGWLRQGLNKRDAGHETLSHLHTIRTSLEAAWPASKEHGQGPHIRQAIRRLRADAEFHAGVGETEVFRDAELVWKEYDFLEQAFQPAKE